MNRSIAIFIALLLVALPTHFVSPAQGVEIGGVTLPDHLILDKQECRLAGSGLRKKFFIKVYALGFYLQKPVNDLQQAVDSDQPKAVLMHFIHDGISGEKLQEAWREGFAGNTPAPLEDLRKRMDDFTALFNNTAHRNDRVLLAYLPGRGTTVSFNDRKIATIPGQDFMQALLRIWFGEQPADSGLKKQVAHDLRDGP